MPTPRINLQHARELHEQGRAHELHGGAMNGKLIKAAVYGANDGIVTTFAVVAGVAGAGLSPAIVLILGFANLIADGISMGVGDYLGERSEQKYKKYQYMIEKWEIKNIPDEEAKELQAFFTKYGVNDGDSKELVTIIKKYPELWTELGFIDEMGEVMEEDPNLWLSGVVTFGGFLVAGALPLMPYVLEALGMAIPLEDQFVLSAIATGATMFVIGSLRTLVTKGVWWRNGLEMLGIGALAAVAAFGTGAVVKQFTGGLF